MSDDTKPTVDRDGLAKLREPFGPEHIGLLPKVTCKDCSDRKVQCQQHRKAKCQECQAWISPAHIHLDFVGHGATTNRLLDVDLEWNWEPLAFDQGGMPTMVYDKSGNPISFWIRLTVCGVTRLGVGTCPSGQPDAEKVLIGDALRNAAMRFGVALDLWIKGQAEDDEKATATSERSGPERSQPAKTISAKDMIPAKDAKDRLVEAASGDMDAAAAAWTGAELGQARQITPDQMAAALAKISDPRAANEAFSEAIRERRHATEQGQFVESGK